ncbi:GspH/FimT family pseudopilin [Agarivorans sp. 1_MG-2023]|uniref:GspH/FimT family pseudopilin n=1 Tax=Agarivorans sp. 1_MG-2023 TaxID=3062634 RepID=UPI0026E495D8|nr:GspH/FimT family pseudopilin [Agarivorans sp. 1_MG-2023]MDO6763457.1 GspH/FimT family pseudopilin [Agarivorans sp. 1_MG-2023]
MLGIPKQRYTARGFTLIELMIAVAILVIVMVVAVPSLQGFMQDNKQKVTRDLLANSLMVAQQEAIRNNLSTYVCPTTNGSTCETAWGANKGWLVFLDETRSGNLESNDTIIAAYPSPKSAELKYSPSASGSTSTLVRFFPTGHALAGELTVCAPSNDYDDQRIAVSRMGRIEYAAPSTTYCP